MNSRISYKPIGYIRSPFKDISGVPIQPAGAKRVKGTIELKKEYVPGLKDLEEFSHIILLYHFHLVKGFDLNVIPFLDKESHGLFATRAPKRPNSIGLSVVKLYEIKDNIIYIENIDVIDGTPLLDIKPYVNKFDAISNTKDGWLQYSVNKLKRTKSDTRFK